MEELKKKLNDLLRNNKKWPVIIEGVKVPAFKKATILPATTKSEELTIANGKPDWVLSLEAKAKSTINLLIIEGIDEIPYEEQKKFKFILENRGLNGYDFPDNVQIVLPTKKDCQERIISIIQTLCIYFKA